MTELLFAADAYARSAPARVVAITDDGGVVPDRSLFYPTGGGQPGDGGVLRWAGGEFAVATARKGHGGPATRRRQGALVRIGDAGGQIDLQPCGGTHVARTGGIGRIRIGKIEKKGRQNRRIYVHLAE